LIALPDIIEEIGVTRENFASFADEAVEGLRRVAEGGRGVEELADSLQDTFSILIDEAVAMGETGSAAFQQLILSARMSGQEIEAVSQFIEERLGVALEGVRNIIGAFNEETILTQERLDDLAIIVGAVADAFIQQGGSIDELIPSIDALIEKQREAGLEMSDTFRRLVQERNFLVNNQDVLQQIQGIGQVLEGLGESTFLTTEAFQALNRETVRAFDEIVARTGNEVRALEAVAPLLQQQIDASIQRGEALDSETQALAEQAAAMGLVELQGVSLTNTLLTGFQSVIDVLGQGFGIEVPQLMGQAVTAAQSASAGMVQAYDAGLDAVVGTTTGAIEAVTVAQEASVDAMAGAVATAAETATTAAEQATGIAEEMADRIRQKLEALGNLAAGKGDIEGFGDLVFPEPRQHGGPVDAGRPYLVGESGEPELFVPEVAGTVVPGEAAAMPAPVVNATVIVKLPSGQEVQGEIVDVIQQAADDGRLEIPHRNVRIN
jgi:hypothetical protein